MLGAAHKPGALPLRPLALGDGVIVTALLVGVVLLFTVAVLDTDAALLWAALAQPV